MTDVRWKYLPLRLTGRACIDSAEYNRQVHIFRVIENESGFKRSKGETSGDVLTLAHTWSLRHCSSWTRAARWTRTMLGIEDEALKSYSDGPPPEAQRHIA